MPALFCLLLALPFLAGAPARSQSPGGNPEAISAALLRTHLEFIAADDLAGRATPSPGLDVAARYMASHLRQWGLKPGGDGNSFFQKMPLLTTSVNMEESRVSLDGRSFKAGEDFLPAFNQASIEAPAVYVGDGYWVKSPARDPYSGVDVRGKIMVVNQTNSGHPSDIPKEITQTPEGDESWRTPESYAAARGAVAIIYLPTFNSLAAWSQSLSFFTRDSTRPDDEPEPSGVPEITAGPRLVHALFAAPGSNRAPEVMAAVFAGRSLPAFALADRPIKIELALKRRRETTQNVVAIWEGADERLKDEYVALGAHYDHLGSRPGTGDGIFNGADDDGSGTVALLAIARAFSQVSRPRRSILFVWHAGEERGLWGSRYFVDHSPVPLNQVVAQINIDMIGRSKAPGDTEPRNANLSGPNEIYVIGPAIMSRDLGQVLAQVNDAYLRLEISDRFDRIDDPRRYFFRSDHLNYIRKGIPALFFFAGEHVDYHRPSDEIETIDFDKLERVTRTIGATVWRLAERDERPRVDRQPME